MTPISDKISSQKTHPMIAPPGITEGTLHITNSAVERLRALIIQEQKKSKSNGTSLMLCITVISGGCSGFQYKFDFVTNRKKDDLLFTFDDISVLTDDVSFELLKGVTLDYVQALIGAAFTLRNPNAESSCGCGNSFSI